MFKHLIVQALCVLFSCSIVFAQTTDPYQKGVIHVKLKQSSAAKVSQTSARTIGLTEVDQLNNQLGVTSMKRVFREAGIFEKAHQQFGLHLWYEIRFDDRKSVSEVIKQYKTLDHFESIEPCLKYELVKPVAPQSAAPPTQQSSLKVPTNDPLFSQQWHYHNTGQSGGTPGADISLPQAWSIQSGSSNVIVAVIDGGIDISHPELGGAVWVNADEIPGNHIDDDLNGYIDDVNGYGFGDNTGTIYPHFHATHVGGTIGAITNNGIGVSGIAGGSGSANGVRLMSCAGFGQFGTGGFEDAMVYAADNGAVISQNSWGGGSTAIEAAIDYFVARAGYDNSAANFSRNIQTGPMAGGIVIFAAGNSNTDAPSIGYPASYPPVMAVASTDHSDIRSYFSNYGSWVDIAAPGSEVYSTYPVTLGNYAYLSGTSMACPHVSGVAALVISQFGGTSFFPSLVWDRLQQTADNIDALNPGYEHKLGSGRVNAFQALQVADAIPPGNITDVSIEQSKLTSIALTWTATGASGSDGIASAYEIRYSTSPITAANFPSATLAPSAPRPQISGSTENFEIKNLSNSTLYYFALRARDFSGNWSGLSNIVSASTLLPPIIGVSPTSLTESLYTGGTSVQNITVRNTGASDLNIEVSTTSVSVSSSALPGATKNVLKDLATTSSVKKPGNEYTNALKTPQTANVAQRNMSSPVVLTGTGKLFIVDAASHVIRELNPSTGEAINSFSPPEFFSGGPEGLAYDGKYLYFVSGGGTNTIYQLNPTTGAVVASLPTSVPPIDGLGHNGKYLYAMDYANDLIREIDFDKGTVIRTIAPGVDIGGGLSFGGSRGTLFATNFANAVYEIELETGHILHTFTTRGLNYGLGYSEGLGLLLCSNVNMGTMDAYDPNSGDLKFSYTIPVSSAFASDESGTAWLKADGTKWTIAAGSETNIPVRFDATGLNGGDYSGSVSIASNDPVTPTVVVPVSLHVTGAPNLSIKSDSIDFGDRYATGTYDTIISINNNGTDALNISSMVIDNAAFSLGGATSFSITPNETANVHLLFTPGALGTYVGTLTITSNDPDQGSLAIRVRGRAVAPPVIGVDPNSFEVSLFTGETSTKTMTIQNTGEANLNYYLQIQTEPFTGSVKSSGYAPAQKEISVINNRGENVKSYVFDKAQIQSKGDFTSLPASPVPLTCFTSDPHSGVIYAQQNQGTGFFKYEPVTGIWSFLATAPFNSNNNGGATYLKGKIYTAYTQNSNQLGVYDIATNTWATISLPPIVGTGVISSDGTYIYWVSSVTLVRYNPSTGVTSTLASPPFQFTPWGGLSYLNGFFYGHQGDGTNGFAKYDIAADAWTLLPSVPGGAVLGSAIDPTAKVYYTYGSYGGNSWYAFDINSGTWSVNPLPLFSVYDGGLAFVPTAGRSGIYFLQGELGNGFGRFETDSFSEWLSAAPLSGTIAKNNNQSVEIKFNADHLLGGTYNGTLVVSSNDPVRSQINVPVILHVTGAPDILASRDSVGFGTLFTNQVKQDSISIINDGTDDLIISSITTSAPFTVGFSGPFTLKPGESRQVYLVFNPTVVGSFSGSLSITSNDPDQALLTILMTGSAVTPPVIGVDPNSFEVSLYSGETSTQNMTIQNSGQANLTYNLRIHADPTSSSVQPKVFGIPQKEIITTNNYGEKIKSYVFDNARIEANGDFTSLPDSPTPLTCFTSDPRTGILYGQESYGNRFYKFDPSSNTWTSLASCPLPSGNNGGAAYLNGKIYTSYTGDNSRLCAYDITTDSWATISVSAVVNTGDIESDDTYLYWISPSGLVKYDPSTGIASALASPPFQFTPWGGLSYNDGFLYGHQGNAMNGFAKYEIATNTWTALPSVPGGAVLGSAIDPTKKIYYTYGSYSGTNWYAYDIASATWSVTPLPLFWVDDGGLAYVPTAGKSGIYFIQGEVGSRAGRFETDALAGWLSAAPISGTITQNNNQQVAVKFDATHLYGGTYNGTLVITSNDPVQPQINVPAILHVTGAPNIIVNKDSIGFGTLFPNQSRPDSILIRNEGTDDLIISSISTSAPFAVAFSGSFTLKPGEGRTIQLSFNPISPGVFIGNLTIVSNDRDQGSLSVALVGQAIPAPVISVTPTSLSASLLTGQQQTKTVTISNTGGSPLTWNASVLNAGSNAFADVLANLDANYTNITSLIPNRYDFYEGTTGSSIYDGGNDMYDGGNMLGTNFGGPLNYTQGVITTSPALGASGGSYFTKKYPGLFVMAADVNASYFETYGDLGADGGGSADGATLNSSFGGKNYKGFVKRVYNAGGDPSVNHLIIIEDNQAVTNSYSLNTNYDNQNIGPLWGAKATRVYYLLFAGNAGYYIDNTAMLNIMNAFLSTSKVGAGWLSLNKMSGTLAAGQSEIVNVTFDATGLDAGVYSSNITINSNDPATPQKNITATLTVTGVPDIAVSNSTLNFGNTYVGASKQISLTVTNTGTALLSVSSLSTTSSLFTVSPSSLSLNPHDSARVYVNFNPTAVGAQTASLQISSNDPDEGTVIINLSGTGMLAPALTVTPDAVNLSIAAGDRKYSKVTLKNTGGSRLDWSLETWQSPYWSVSDLTSGSLLPNAQTQITFSLDAKGVAAGTYTWYVWVDSNDPIRPQVAVPFTVTISQDHAPSVTAAIGNQSMMPSTSLDINLANYFSDADLEALKYYAQSDSTTIVSTSLLGSVLTVTANHSGNANVSVVAQDGMGEIASQTFSVNVITVVTGIEDLAQGSKFSNHPNPFENTTKVAFRLTKAADVSLKLYDATGRELPVMQNKPLEEGDHEVELGDQLVGGIYLCRLVINGTDAGTIKIMKK